MVNKVFRASDVEYSIQISHRVLNLSKVSLSMANLSSIRIMSFIVDTHKVSGGLVEVFQNKGMICLAADKKKA